MIDVIDAPGHALRTILTGCFDVAIVARVYIIL
jgi:hypothetical protein